MTEVPDAPEGADSGDQHQLDEDLRDDAHYERVLFLRFLAILLIVALAVVARALFL